MSTVYFGIEVTAEMYKNFNVVLDLSPWSQFLLKNTFRISELQLYSKNPTMTKAIVSNILFFKFHKLSEKQFHLFLHVTMLANIFFGYENHLFPEWSSLGFALPYCFETWHTKLCGRAAPKNTKNTEVRQTSNFAPSKSSLLKSGADLRSRCWNQNK